MLDTHQMDKNYNKNLMQFKEEFFMGLVKTKELSNLNPKLNFVYRMQLPQRNYHIAPPPCCIWGNTWKNY